MEKPAQEILAFGWAVLSYWQALVTGGVVTALLEVAQRLFGWEIRRRHYFWLFVVAYFLAAFFLAWRDEHRAIRSLQQNLSNRENEIVQFKMKAEQLSTQFADKDARLKAFEARPLEVKVKQEKPDPDRIALFLQYAYEWNYMGARNMLGEMAKRIDRKTPLKKRYSASEERLQIGIENENDIPLEEVWLAAQFPGEEVQIRAVGAWQVMLPNRDYFVRLGQINNNSGLGPNGSLFVKFPKPGHYYVNYIISAKWLPNVVKSIEIILDD